MFRLREPYTPPIVGAFLTRGTTVSVGFVRTGYEYGEEVDGQKYIGRHGDQNGVEWALWDSCPSAASFLDCEPDTRFRATQSAYSDVRMEWLDERMPVGYSAPSRDELVEKITAFATTPQPLKAGTPIGEPPPPPPPLPKKITTKTAPTKSSSPVSAPTASIAQGDNTTIIFVLLGAIGAGLLVYTWVG